jgi:hypothetical protein
MDRFVYYVFDLLHLDGVDLTGEPLIARKAALERLLKGSDPDGTIRYSAHFEETGSEMLSRACHLNLEGIISKRRDAPYQSGRSDNWIKSKCAQNQELVIVGYKDATHLKGAVGALVLGYNEDGGLRYAGRSGTGYTRETARDLWKRLQPLRRADPAFGKIPEEERGRKGIWVEPKLVAEITFGGWTAQKHVRHAVFKGLREDKPAKEIVRERTDADQSSEKARKEIRESTRKARDRKIGAQGGCRRGQADPSGPHLLERRRGHQAAAGRLLHRGMGPYRAASGAASARVVALSGRRRRTMLLPEARSRRTDQRAHPPPQGRPRRGADLHR